MHRPGNGAYSENAGDWLETALVRDLRAVSAPPGLWNRIQHPQPRKPAASSWRFAWVAAAALLAVAGVWGFHSHSDLALNETLAIQALSQDPGHLDFRSDKAAQIRAWAKTNAGIDLPFAAEPASCIRMIGACTIRSGQTGVEVAYRASGRDATLLVSRAKPAHGGGHGHHFLKSQHRNGMRVSSWTMGGQLYTLAYASSGDLSAACRLCHDGREQATAVN